MPEFVLQGRNDPRIANADAFTIAYITAALFTEEENLISVAVQQLSDELIHTMHQDCTEFQRRAHPILELETTTHRLQDRHSLQEQAAHDFWLTRNGHGVGFWDGDWSEPAGSRLDEIAKAFPSVDLYRGDDGRIYS